MMSEPTTAAVTPTAPGPISSWLSSQGSSTKCWDPIIWGWRCWRWPLLSCPSWLRLSRLWDLITFNARVVTTKGLEAAW